MISIQVDASVGILCKPGDLVRKGQYLGKMPGNIDKRVVAPSSGIVKTIKFLDESHVLEITIQALQDNL